MIGRTLLLDPMYPEYYILLNTRQVEPRFLIKVGSNTVAKIGIKVIAGPTLHTSERVGL